MTHSGETESIVSLKLYSSLFSRNFVEIERLLTPCNGISILESGTFLLMESGIRENFACGIRNPEYSSSNPESHNIPLTIGIQNPKSSTDKDWNPECTARNIESKPLLGLILGRAYLQIYPGGWALGYKASAREASLLDAILSDVHPSIRMKVVWPHVK